MTVTVEYDSLIDEVYDIIGQEMHSLYAELIDVSYKVWDTGEFNRSFIAPKELARGNYIIINTANHSSILALGRHKINGKEYGSMKWFYGLSPMLSKTTQTIETRTNEVHR